MGQAGLAVDRALALRDLDQGLIEWACRIGDDRPRALAVELGDGAVDRADALFDLGGRGTALADQLIEPLVEPGDSLGELGWRFIGGRGRQRAIGAGAKLVDRKHERVEAFVDGAKRGVGSLALALIELPRQHIGAILHGGKYVAGRLVLALFEGLRGRREAIRLRREVPVGEAAFALVELARERVEALLDRNEI